MSEEHLTVIIPCFNEAKNIAQTVDSVLEVLKTLPMQSCILMVDDGSTDGTGERMEDICHRHAECRMRVNPRNLGIGRSVLQSYAEIPSGGWVTVCPGDNEFVFSSIRNHLAVRDRYDLILGYVHNTVTRTLPRRIASQSFIEAVKFLYGFPYRYLNGMKLYRVDIFRGIEVVSGGHAFNAELIAKAILRNPEIRVGEVPFVQLGRGAGKSKAISPQSIVRAVQEVVRGYVSVGNYRQAIFRQRVP